MKDHLEESVLHYARLAKQSGLDGVVCSPLEAVTFVNACGADFLTVTPGIRMADDAMHMIRIRIATPENARELGSYLYVVGTCYYRSK